MIIKSEKDMILSYLEDSSNLRSGIAGKVVIPEALPGSQFHAQGMAAGEVG